MSAGDQNPAGQGGASQPIASPSSDSNNSPVQPTDQGNQDLLRAIAGRFVQPQDRPIPMTEASDNPAGQNAATGPAIVEGSKMTTNTPKIEEFFLAYLKKKSKLNFELLLARLDKAVARPYEEFLQYELNRIEITGERLQGMDPPRDVASFILDELLEAFFRQRRKKTPENKHQRQKRMPHLKELRQLGIELDGIAYLALIGAYAHQRSDVDGVRRVWDIFTNQRSLYWMMFDDFRKRRLVAIKSKNPRDRRMPSWVFRVRNMTTLLWAIKLQEKHSQRTLADILASECKLSPGRIRALLKKEILEDDLVKAALSRKSS
jgi:hypothetical protein